MSQNQSMENVVFKVIIGAVVALCILVGGTLAAMTYSTNAIEKEKQTINHFKDGKVIICKPNITTINNKEWKYDETLMAFTKELESFKAINCQVR